MYRFRISASLTYCKILTIAEIPLPNIKPRIKIVVMSLTFMASKRITINTRLAPIIPDNPIIILEDTKNGTEKLPKPSITIATPKLAPELIPSTYGPASGLRKIVCINKPLTDKAMPETIAVKTRGKRISLTIISILAFGVK